MRKLGLLRELAAEVCVCVCVPRRRPSSKAGTAASSRLVNVQIH
jgi:hypothetical protein